MQQVQFHGRVTALSSISHNGGQSFGISSKLRRETFVQPDLTTEEVPVISGNAMRGVLRDRGMFHFCRCLGYGDPITTEEGKVTGVCGLSKTAFYYLFSGGSLTAAGKGMDIDRARELNRMIPLASVLGGAIGGQIMPGKVKIGKMIPICRETNHLLPETFQMPTAQSIWEYTQEEMYTRKDDAKNEHLRQVLEGSHKAIASSLQPSLIGDVGGAMPVKSKGTALEEKEGTPQQMMYFVETLAAGTSFYWRIILDNVTDLEFEAFLVALVEFSKMPYVGGKSGTGLGEISVDFNQWVRIDSRLVQGEEVGAPIGDAYRKHLNDHGPEIRRILEAL
jgi:CRISPR type IV-associated protein Csf2